MAVGCWAISSVAVAVGEPPLSQNSTVSDPCLRIVELEFEVRCFFALGSPLGMFLTIKGNSFGVPGVSKPNCVSFFNIFHPKDPIAYRLEPLIAKRLAKMPPMTLPCEPVRCGDVLRHCAHRPLPTACAESHWASDSERAEGPLGHLGVLQAQDNGIRCWHRRRCCRSGLWRCHCM